jgi:hypothetical protein
MAELKGFERMLSALIEKKLQVLRATPEALSNAGFQLEAAIKTELSRSAHSYGTPTPSSPGEPPSLVTGNLRRSIQAEGPDRAGPGRWSMKIGPEAVYSRVQELGGGPSHLPARPYMAPALASALPSMQATFEQAWTQALE